MKGYMIFKYDASCKVRGTPLFLYSTFMLMLELSYLVAFNHTVSTYN